MSLARVRMCARVCLMCVDAFDGVRVPCELMLLRTCMPICAKRSHIECTSVRGWRTCTCTRDWEPLAVLPYCPRDYVTASCVAVTRSLCCTTVLFKGLRDGRKITCPVDYCTAVGDSGIDHMFKQQALTVSY